MVSVCLLIAVSLTVIIYSAARVNKNVMIESAYERFLVYFDGVSSFGNLVDVTGSGSEQVPISDKLKAFLALAFYEPSNLFSNEVAGLPLLRLDVPFKNVQALRLDRVRAIEKGYLSDPEWVAGALQHSGNNFSVKLRLKGDLPSHWSADTRFSLRVSLKKNRAQNGAQSVLGMRTFSLHKLRTRQFPYEHIFQDLLKKEGLPSVSHKLVRVSFNGEDWGVMDMQEHFTPEMLEKNGLKASTVFRLSDDRHWLAYSRSQQLPLGVHEYWLSNPRIFVDLVGQKSKKKSNLQELHLNYVRSRLRESDYDSVLFDQSGINSVARMLKVWGNPHPISLANSRFYLNPFTIKLEPLIADQGPFKDLSAAEGDDPVANTTQGFLYASDSTLSDPAETHFDQIVRSLIDITENRVDRAYFPGDAALNTTIPRSNASRLRKDNFPQKRVYRGYALGELNCTGDENSPLSEFESIVAWFSDVSSLNITPLHCQELEILTIDGCGTPIGVNQVLRYETININLPSKLKLQGLIWPRGADYPHRKVSKTEFPFFDWLPCENTKLHLNYLSNGISKTTVIDPQYFVERDQNPFLRESAFHPDFIRINKDKNYYIEDGDWEINGPIVIRGNLLIRGGAKLNFSKDAYLIVDGSLQIDGALDNPVILGAKIQGERWRGIYVLGSGREQVSVNIKNTHFRDMKNLSDGLLQLTGAITVYNADVRIEEVKISNTVAEDALNIVRSGVTVDRLWVEDTISDAFDCDFCKGEFNSLNFYNVGGDGFDVSGSEFSVNIQSASKVQDKVVSVGEQSRGSISISSTDDSYVAVAVKDAGSAQIRLQNTETIGPLVMTYIKKDFYEGDTLAFVELGESVSSNQATPFVAASETTLVVNGKAIQTEVVDVDKLYSSGPMKKN